MSALEVAPLPLVDVTAHPPWTSTTEEPSVCLRDVPWVTYLSLREADRNNALRMTYDCGDLEIMSPSGKHARVSWLLGYMICEWTLMKRIMMAFGGDMTLKRADLTRGLEADHCFWLANEAKVRGKDEIDLQVDPPPDLAIEVEVSNPLVRKLPIYQSLGVAEVWRWRNETLSVLTLDQAKGYIERSDSVMLPGFPFRLAEDLVRRRQLDSTTELLFQIRADIARIAKT